MNRRNLVVAFAVALSTTAAGLAIAADPQLPKSKPAPMIVQKSKPDITSAKGGIIIGGSPGGAGGQFVAWGGDANLSGVEPLPGTVTADGRCAFNVTYYETNTGMAPTAPAYTNKLYVGGNVRAINSGRQLNAGETKSVTTQPYLSQGTHSLRLVLDDGNAVAESNEGNNQFSIRYKLKCRSGQQADLVPVMPNPMNGTIGVKNIGAGPAGPSKLVLNCRKAGHPGPGGGCAEIPPGAMGPYSDPAFPDRVVVNVPALAPGATHLHTLRFWPLLKWTKGTYHFSGTVDAANVVAESNEGNNNAASTLTVP